MKETGSGPLGRRGARREWQTDARVARGLTPAPAGRRPSLALLGGRVLAADLGLEDLPQAILDLAMGFIHFLVRQGAVVGLVSEGEGQALGPLRDTAAAVQVEQA